jgi:hypothetical protein
MTKRMIMTGALGLGVTLAGVGAAIAQQSSGGVINVGDAFGWFAPYVNSAVGALITVGLTWLTLLLRTKLNVSIDDSMRQALETFLKNQASSLIADGAVKFQGTAVNVSSPALAAAANTALKLIPDTMAHFGLTPEVIAQKIIDAIPQNATAAAVVAAKVEQPPTVVVDNSGKK